MKTRIMKRLGFAALAAGLVMALATPAHATLALRLTSSLGGVVGVIDGGPGDANPNVGVITYITGLVTPLNGWGVNVTTGLSKPVLGSASAPSMDLNSVNSSAQASTLTIEWTDTDFNTVSPTSFAMNIGGTSGGSVNYDAYYDLGNNPFSTSNSIGNLAFVASPFSGSTSGGPVVGGPFSLTQVVTINHGSGIRTTSFDAELLAVPEPGTLALFGMSILGLGVALRRRLAQAA